MSLEGPVGEVRADWRAGMLASTIANIHRDPKRRARPWSPQDFMFGPLSDQANEEDDQAERSKRLLEKVAGINAALGGQDKRQKTG